MTFKSTVVRQDIQGLRTIGALLVAAFHIWEGGVSGGVDVFFVVSGYFLGIAYLRLCAADKSLSAAKHFGRFINRTVPEVLMVLFVALTIGLAFQNPAAWRELLKDIFYSALYLENYWLIQQGQDYLERSSEVSLVQHFWAVSLIAQVYASWFFIARSSDFIAGFLEQPRLLVMRSVLAVLVIGSFAWSIYETSTNPSQSYFAFATRFWQFGMGALLALTLAGRSALSKPKALVDLLSWTGLALLLSCGLIIGSTAAFPGFASLWPVAAAALILVTGRETEKSNAGAYLRAPILARLGTYSFGIYVWHWPLYVIAFRLNGQTPSILLGCVIILVSIGLAYLSKLGTDAVVRRSGRLLPPLGFSAACVGALISVAAIAGGSHEVGTTSTVVNNWAARLIGLNTLSPGPLMAISDATKGRVGCNQTGKSEKPTRCTVRHPDATIEVFLVGGSHSEHWMPALKAVSKDQGWNISAYTKNACPFASPIDEEMFHEENLHTSCAAWNDAAMDIILSKKPDLVVTLATRAAFEDPPSRGDRKILSEHVPDGYVMHLQRLADAGIPTVALRDTPRMMHDVPSCVYAPRHLAERESCNRARSVVVFDDPLPDELSKLPADVGYVDMNDTICDATTCYAVRDDMLVYRDSHHLTATYARHLGPTLADRITKVLEGR